MAVGTITPQNVNPIGASANPSAVPVGPFRVTSNNVVPTSGANYAAGGVPITAAQLGLTAVLFGVATALTQAATVGPGEVAVIPQADGSVLLKCGLAAGSGDNAAGANLSATLVNIVAFGY